MRPWHHVHISNHSSFSGSPPKSIVEYLAVHLTQIANPLHSEHRQRKETYQRDLEQEIVNLREMITTATTQSALFKHENMVIRDTLSKSQIPVTLSDLGPIPTPSTLATLSTAPTPAIILPDLQQRWTKSGQSLVSDESPWLTNSIPPLSTSSSSLVSIGYDDVINASCLRISSPNFLFPSTEEDQSIFSIDPSTTTDAYTHLTSQIGPEDPTRIRSVVGSEEEDLEITAINFILALESPCRAHFHGRPIKPDGTTGHELMASTLLYASAPQSVFDHPDFKDPVSWYLLSPLPLNLSSSSPLSTPPRHPHPHIPS